MFAFSARWPSGSNSPVDAASPGGPFQPYQASAQRWSQTVVRILQVLREPYGAECWGTGLEIRGLSLIYEMGWPLHP